MNRRGFAGTAALTVAAAIGANSFPLAGAARAMRLNQTATPRPEAQCIPAIAVRLGPGQAYILERSAGRAFSIRFVAVEDDGRCAVSQGVQCVWAGQATVVVEVDRGSGSGPDTVRFDWIAGSVFHVVWGHQGMRLFVVAAGLSGDAGTPRESLALDLVVFPEWPGQG